MLLRSFSLINQELTSLNDGVLPPNTTHSSALLTSTSVFPSTAGSEVICTFMFDF